MSIRKINNSDYKNLLISNLPTRPNASPSNFGGGGLSANQMKKAYDATPLFIIARFNELIDYINGTGDARLADDILNAIKGIIAKNVETKITGIETLADLFASVESGELAKAIRVSDGKSLDETLKTIGEETITEVERILAEYKTDELAPIVEQAEILRESVESAQSRLSRVEKKVENLGASLRLPIIEDTDVAYTKIAPDGALPYAEVAKVGGMSHSVYGSLVHAKVTEIRSASANLLRPFNTEPVTENGITMQYLPNEDCFVFNGSLPRDEAVHFYAPYHITTEHNRTLEVGAFYVSGDFSGDGYGNILVDDDFHENGGIKSFVADLPTESYNVESGSNAGPSHGEFEVGFHFWGGEWGENSMLELYNYKVRVHFKYCEKESTEYAGAYNPNLDSLKIPAEVQALEGYGLGVDAEYNNHIDWEKKKYHHDVGQYVFDGTENVTFSPTQLVEGYRRFDVWKTKEGAGAKTERCVCNKYDYNGTNKPGVWFNNSSSDKLEFRIMTNEFPDSNSLQNALKYWYAEGNPLTVVYPLAVPTETDISDLLPDENFIRVEGGGTITAVNEYGLAAPTEIIYQTEG